MVAVHCRFRIRILHILECGVNECMIIFEKFEDVMFLTFTVVVLILREVVEIEPTICIVMIATFSYHNSDHKGPLLNKRVFKFPAFTCQAPHVAKCDAIRSIRIPSPFQHQANASPFPIYTKNS